MSLTDITSRQAILDAIAECDRLGRPAFLQRYGFRPARDYHLVEGGRVYDSKAIVGVAHKYQFPAHGPLRATDFSGGFATVQRLLESLGFTLRVTK